MESSYLLSVIVTVHNEEKYIDACLCSILDERRDLSVEIIYYVSPAFLLLR